MDLESINEALKARKKGPDLITVMSFNYSFKLVSKSDLLESGMSVFFTFIN